MSSTNWENVIRNQMSGMDAVSAFYKEEERVRKENESAIAESRKRYEESVRRTKRKTRKDGCER